MFLRWRPISSATIDTLGYVKKLESAGIDRKVAEAHAEALNERVVPQLATQQNLRDAVSELKVQMQELKLEIWKVSIGIILATATLSAFVQKLVR